MKLHYQTLGQGGSPLVCLHGFLGSGENLWPLADHLKDSHRSLLMDLRGHGSSPQGGPYTHAAMAEDVAETLRADGIPSAAVLGHSLGGKVAMALALLHPELVERLIIADITMARAEPYFNALLEDMARVPVATLSRRDDGEPYLRDVEPILATRRFLLKNLVPDPQGGFRWRMDLEGLKRDQPALLAQGPSGPPYQGKALLIHGTQSQFVAPEGIELTKHYFPDMKVLDLPGGHWIHVDAKDLFNQAVAEFLN